MSATPRKKINKLKNHLIILIENTLIVTKLETEGNKLQPNFKISQIQLSSFHHHQTPFSYRVFLFSSSRRFFTACLITPVLGQKEVGGAYIFSAQEKNDTDG